MKLSRNIGLRAWMWRGNGCPMENPMAKRGGAGRIIKLKRCVIVQNCGDRWTALSHAAPVFSLWTGWGICALMAFIAF